MAGTITFSGLSSGLDTTSWIESLVSVKSTTVTSLQEEQKLQQELLNVVNGIKSYFSSFQSALQKITDSQFGIPTMDLFMQNLATSSNTNIVTATATTEAARQSYDVLVDQLATSTKATSGQKEITTQYATLNTKLGVLGVKNGTITVDSKSFNITEDDTIKTLIQKFSDVGVVASFDDKKSTFTVNTSLDKIDDGSTGLKNALKLKNNSVSGVISGSLVYADRDSELAKLGVTAGDVQIEGVKHTITRSGDNYTIKKDGATTATTINTLGQFLDYLKGSEVNAEEATVDDNGNITIRGAVIESVTGGSNIKDALKLGDVIERTIMESQNLTYQQGHFADLSSTLEDLGITSNKTLVIDGTSNTLTKTSTLQDMKDLLAADGIDMSVDTEGVITIDTNGVEISGTVLDALGLEANKGGTTLTSGSHTVTYKAKGDTLLSELGVTSSMGYTAYKSDGTQVGVITGNNENITVDDLINQLKGFGLNASFDSTTHQIKIDDGYIDGTLANQLGMSSKTDYYQEAATDTTTLEELGANATQTLIIDGNVKNYDKTATLSTVIQDIKNAGGVVDFDDGIMTVSGVTLSGSLTGLLGFEATSQGTTITSGALSIVTDSSSTSTGGVEETTDNNIELTSKIGDITGTVSNYTLSVNGGAVQTITKDTTLQTVSDLITAQGGIFKINADNTITIKDVNISGTLVSALGFASVGQGTEMTSNTPIVVGGVENIATVDNTLKDIGVTGTKSLVIDGVTKNYADTTKISAIFADIQAAGGTAKIEDGVISIQGVTLGGDIVDIFKLTPTISGTTISSGALSVVKSTSSTSSSVLRPTTGIAATMSTQLGEIADIGTPTLSINNGTEKTYQLTDTLATIRADIQAAGGTMSIDVNGKIVIEGVNLSGSLVNTFGFTATGQSTIISSNDPVKVTATGQSTSMTSNVAITMQEEKYVTGDTYIDYIVNGGSFAMTPNSSDYSYELYDTYGNVIMSTSSSGTYVLSGTQNVATIDTWINEINNAMNAYYGTVGLTYARLMNNGITIEKGYVAGTLPGELGITTSSSLAGIQIQGTKLVYGAAGDFIDNPTPAYEADTLTKLSGVTAFSPSGIYGIYDAADLQKLAELVNNGNDTTGVTFVLKNDIDMSGVNFTPIGTYKNYGLYQFKGEFYGNGYTISNLKINYSNSSYTSYVGLFGYTNGATIQDVGLSNVTISGHASYDSTYAGALVGYAYNTTITNSFVNGGTVTGTVNYDPVFVGGLVGYLQNSDISYSYSTAKVQGRSNNSPTYVGGLIGYSNASSSDKNTISNSYSSGNVSTIGTAGYIVYSGGFVGYSQYTNYSNSYSRGNVTGSTDNYDTIILGSFAGHISYNSFNNVYSMGSVSTPNTNYVSLGSFYASNGGGNTFTNTVYNSLLGLVNDRTTAQSGLEGWSPSQIDDENNTLPKLQLRNPNENTSLSMMGLKTEADRTLTMTVGATMYTKTFDADDTIKDVITYMNALPGTKATFEDSTLKVSTTSSSELKVGGNLGEFLLSEEAGSQFIYQTENNDKELKYLNKNKKVNNNTTMAELLGNTSGGTLKILINDSQQVNLTYSATDTIQNVLDDLMMNGIDASISSSGVFTATSDNKVSLSGSVAHALLGDSPTVQYTANGTGLTLATPGDRIDTILNGGTTSSNSSDYSYVIYDSAGNIIQAESTNGTYNMSGSQNNATFNDWISAINNAMNSYYGTSGVTYAAMRDSVLEITGGYVSGNLPNGLGITTKPSVTTTVSGTSITYEKPIKFIGTAMNFTAPDDAVRVSDVTGNNFTSGKTYLISDASDLQELATKVNAGGSTSGANFVLTTDIDMSGVANFTPIGNSAYIYFQGNFYGNGHTISNLTINVSLSTHAYTGLFGRTDGAVIRDVGLENVSVINKVTDFSDDAWTGALVGNAQNTTISNVYVDKGSVQSNHSGYYHQMYTGGLVGHMGSGKIEYSYSTVSVVADNSYNNQNTCTGGLVGFNSAQIFDSYATGNVSVYSDLDSSGYHVSSGGFVGYNTNLITRSFSTGQVTVSGSGNNVNKIYTGGFVGWNYSTISNSYSLGRPQANNGTVGAFAGKDGTYNNCYYNTESGFTGGNSFIGITGKTQAEILADPLMPQLVGYQTTNILATNTLSEIGLTIGSQRALMLNINGSSYLKEFNADDTVQTVVDYLNSFSGVSASFENSKLVVKVGDSQDISLTGDIATRLLGGSGTYTQSTGTANAANRLYYAKLSSATRVGDLLGTNQGGELKLLVDGTQYVLNYDANDTMRDIMDDLLGYGVNTSITADGVFTANSTKSISLLGNIGHALLGDNSTVTYGSNKYTSDSIQTQIETTLSNSTTLKELGIDSGTIQILDGAGGLVNNISIDNTKTISQISSILSAYGFNMSLDTGAKKVTITSNSQYQLADGTSNLISGLNLDTWNPISDKVDATTTLEQLGFKTGSTLNILLDGTTQMNFTFGARNTVQDIINSLGAIGINASIDSTGVFSATSNAHSFIFTGDLASALTDGTTGYQNVIQGYESYNPLTYMSAYQNMSETTTVADLLSSTAGGTLRVILDGNQVINLDYKSTDTLKTIMSDLAALGIGAEINSSVFSANSTEKSFTFAGNIGNVLQGNSPTYNTYDSEFLSDELAYKKNVLVNDNSILKGIGVSSGQVYVLDANGDVINSIDISNTMTIAQTKAALKAYGFDMSIDGSGKITISSDDGYSLIDGSSDMISKFKLNNWNQTTETLKTTSTLAQMGFKDGADLNMLIDGTVSKTLSFGANETVQDIINSLNAIGIQASIDPTTGAFQASSTEHSFIFNGDLAKFLTSGSAGYINADKNYVTKDQLLVDIPYVTDTSGELTYTKNLEMSDTVESMGFKDGGVIRLTLDGNTQYSLSFLASDTMQDIADAFAVYGIQVNVGTNGELEFRSDDHEFALGGALGNFLVQGGVYNNKDTGYISKPINFNTTENIDLNTKLSSLGVSNGYLNILKDNEIVTSGIYVDETTTLGQLFSAIKVYGINGSIMTRPTGETYIQLKADGDLKLVDGTSDVVQKLGLNIVNQGDYDSQVTYWDTNVPEGLITEDMLLSNFDKNGFTAAGSLIFKTGTGADAVEHIVNISASDTVGDLLKKLQNEGVNAVLQDGLVRIDNGINGISFTGGTSGLLDTLNLVTQDVDTYASSESAITYEEETVTSVSNYADGGTLLSTVNVTDGNLSIYVDGVKATVVVNSTDTFETLFDKIVAEVGAKTGKTIKAGFLDTDGNIVKNPTADKNTGIVALEMVGGEELVIGASNDTTNFATIANLSQKSDSTVEGTRALYKVNINSLVTGAGLFKEGDITEGTFTIGDATFTIDSTTTLNSLIKQINASDKAYASAYWDTLSGTLVLQSTLTGESLINIEGGTSNFTDIMGFTETVNGVESLVTSAQTLGKNAIVRINGTTVTSSSNVITSDISKIKGLTLNLKGLSNGESTTITVEQDDDSIYNAVSDIVDSYNTLMEGIEKELSGTTDLAHDTMLKLIKNNIKRLVTSSLAGSYVFKNLAAIGITTGEASNDISTDVTGLVIDKEKFMQALEDDSESVKILLSGTTNKPGILLQIGQIVDNALSSSGYIGTTENRINKNISNLQDKITAQTAALAKYRERLEARFSLMESVISNMQNSYVGFLNK